MEYIPSEAQSDIYWCNGYDCYRQDIQHTIQKVQFGATQPPNHGLGCILNNDNFVYFK